MTVAALALGAGAAAAGFKYVAATMRENEAAQRRRTDSLYVSVDRSGGGV